MSKFSGIFKKLKSIKHIEIILAVLLGLIVLLVYFSSTSSLQSNKTTVTTSTNIYLQEVENKLENLISEINGAGRVSVRLMSESEEIHHHKLHRLLLLQVVQVMCLLSLK